MSGIRGKDTQPELIVRRFLHRRGFRFRLHARELPGRPDLVLPRYRAAIFVHGCFWHRHPDCRFTYRPKSHQDFWEAKLEGNVTRDERKERELRHLEWRVYVVWACEATEERLGELAMDIADRPVGNPATA